ncbi:MAG: hypothetical protein ABIO50_04230 [Nitrosospira sp.]
MPRKPVHLELAGGQSRRQRIWNRIRDMNGVEFDISDVTPGDVPIDNTRAFVASLACAGYLEIVQASGPRKRALYRLTRDSGVEVPRVTRQGTAVTQGQGNEALWGAMQALGGFNTRILAEMAGVKESTVKSYCKFLTRAGYLTIDREGKRKGHGGIATQYRLLTSRVNGPRPPMITRLKAVYDPNIHAIVWQQNADDAIEEMEAAR